jgi:glycosyltransferase involved in cell wall biosynthesis
VALLIAGDMLAIATAQAACFYTRYYTPLLPPARPPTYPFILFLSLTLLVACLTLATVGGYRLPRRFHLNTISATLLRTMAGHIVIVTLATYLLRLGMQFTKRPFLYSRPVVVTGWILMFVLLLMWRLVVGRLQRAILNRGWGMQRTIVAGTGRHASELASALQQKQWMGYGVLGLVGPKDGNDAPAPVLGDVEDLASVVERCAADVVWVTWSAEHPNETLHLLLDNLDLPVKWAMTPLDSDHLLQNISNAPLPARLPSWDRDALADLLTRQVKHTLDPLAGPRITFVGSRGIPATYGGVERYVEGLSWRLAERGYQVSVYCRPHYASQRGIYRGVQLRHLPCIRTKHLEAISHTLLATLHLLFFEDEIVHYQALGPSLLAWLPRLFGRRTVVTVQGLDWQRSKWGRAAQIVLRAGELASAILPHRIIVVSRDLQRHYRERYGKPAIYIPNGVTEAQRQPVHDIHRLGLEEKSYLLAVGRLVPEKRYGDIIRAFRRVKTDKQLVIAGGSSHSESYVDSLHALAEGAPVTFTGYVYGRLLEELYSNAYAFLSASEVEGLPIALLEAMSYGTCPLVSDIPAHVEALGELGHTFQTGDDMDLTVKLQTLLDAPHTVTCAADALRQRVVELYSWDKVTDATEKVYQSMLSSVIS